MARTALDKLRADPSKKEEIDFLNEVAESIPDDAYLKSLFTEQMVGWVARRIGEDIMPDLYQWFLDGITDCDKREREVREICAEMEGALKAAEHRYGEMRTFMFYFKDCYSRQREYSKRLKIEKANAIGELYLSRSEWAEEAQAMKGTIEQLQSQVLLLKAKMFDLIEDAK